MQNADFRFCTQIRSHFLLHQKANLHRYSERYPYFRLSHDWHTNSDTSWDVPSFLLPFNWYTNNDISQLFCYPSIDTQMVTQLGISQDFHP